MWQKFVMAGIMLLTQLGFELEIPDFSSFDLFKGTLAYYRKPTVFDFTGDSWFVYRMLVCFNGIAIFGSSAIPNLVFGCLLWEIAKLRLWPLLVNIVRQRLSMTPTTPRDTKRNAFELASYGIGMGVSLMCLSLMPEPFESVPSLIGMCLQVGVLATFINPVRKLYFGIMLMALVTLGLLTSSTMFFLTSVVAICAAYSGVNLSKPSDPTKDV